MCYKTFLLAILLAVPAEGRGGRTFWGRCDPLGRCHNTCRRKLKCSDRMSDGPTDADVEIKLANLDASTATKDVHLHWWAARKSPTDYDPLNGLVGCSVYRNMKDAYPSIYASDFNGGNVRVSESGTATIRIRAPSTFFMWHYIAIPHINMRLCTGSSSEVKRGPPDATFYFGSNETWLKQRSGKAVNIQVVSAAPYAARVASTGQDRGPKPVAVIRAARVHAPQTTTTTVATTTPMTQEFAQVLIDAAKDTLSLDALEFSPVYECFLLDKFFDQISSDCVDRCPGGSEVVHGQCARPAFYPAQAKLSTTWLLVVDCSPGQNCWESQNTTLHRARLAAAGHLMIPFQEVTVTVGFNWAGSSRRLLEGQKLYLTVDAKTQRWTQKEGSRLLNNFVSDHEDVGEMLDVTVKHSQIHAGGGSASNTKSMSELNDPYSPAYEALRPKPSQGTDANDVLSVLPPAAIAGIACGVVVFLVSAVVGIIYYRRHQQKNAREAVAQGKMANNNKDPDAKIESNKVEEEDADSVDADHVNI